LSILTVEIKRELISFTTKTSTKSTFLQFPTH